MKSSFLPVICALVCRSGQLAVRAAPITSAVHQVGQIAVPWGEYPDLDVVSDNGRSAIHLVVCGNDALYYLKSSACGEKWSAAESIGEGCAPRLALDSGGVVHMAYATERTGDYCKRVWYRSRSLAGTWSAALEIPYPHPSGSNATTRMCAPRIAVDGDDHAHVICWQFRDSGADPWYDWTSLVYARKRSGQSSFDAALEFSYAKDQTGGAGGADDIMTDNDGNVHLFYRSKGGSTWYITHFMRQKGGAWSSWVRTYPIGAHDWSLMVDQASNGTFYMSLVQLPGTIRWSIFDNSANPTNFVRSKYVDDDEHHSGTTIMVGPGGDIWSAYYNGATSSTWPDRAAFLHYDASDSTWDGPTDFSVPGRVNVYGRHGQVPKWTVYEGRVRCFYAEGQQASAPFRFYQRVFGGSGTVTKPAAP